MKTNTIEQLLTYHFEKGIKNENQMSKPVNSIIKLKGLDDSPTPEQADLAIHFKSIKKRYSVSMDYYTSEDFVSEYCSLFLLVAQDLEVLEPLEELLDNPDIYKQRIRFIMDGISHEMYSVAYPNKTKVKTREGYKYVDNNTISYDVEVGEGSEQTKLINLIGEDQNIFSSKQDSTHNHFIQWFLANREDLLTKKQLETFEKLREIYTPKNGNTIVDNEIRKQMLEDAGLEARSMQKQFKNIKKRVIEKYQEEFKGKWHPVNFEKNKATDTLFAEFIESAIYPNWETAEARQTELTGIIQEAYNINEEFELVVVKGMTLEEKKEIIRGVRGTELISHKVLRKINNNITAEMAQRKPLEIEASYPSFEYNENTFAGLTGMGTNLLITPVGSIVAKDSLQA